MKSWFKKIGHLLWVLAFSSIGYLANAQIYFFEEDEVVFEFDSRIYAKADAENKLNKLDFADLKINEVVISGNFNDWSEDGWRMKKLGRYKFQLRKPIESFDDPFTWEFKFLVNGEYWIEPLPGSAKQKVLSNDFWEETFNLTFNKIDPDENGNTLFQLDGYEWAEEMILAGSFNNWNEHYLKMQKVAGGWQVRIELPPGRYEYKFIADGNWLHDPANPEKVRNEHNTFNSVLQVKKAITFRLRDYPDARKVILAGTFNKWNEQDLKMARQDGMWTITLNLTGGKHLYKFIVDGEWMTDPANHLKETDRHGYVNSVLMVR
ncbi:hypothetical protein [Flavilitoribacter nigricans]|uniref:AMP-activated protein kinase glycogen-binding domain-containing protein n=1 Tax=Flavilitoribacter nigricans (strain ATCC 23147 / DSM 23189 / NBRC 102662 / NCIMB 1420 / SS-2) TaxID=1122177 RepID=A0A2D0N557_FLAN2|nr:hypothetical protein [Flavilitoribacter nigricans]PHN03635.1 hypothetical protein CRP01_25595 [Flavilitoribacter nigricans DSM 23189 = NBRC 102662]